MLSVDPSQELSPTRDLPALLGARLLIRRPRALLLEWTSWPRDYRVNVIWQGILVDIRGKVGMSVNV